MKRNTKYLIISIICLIMFIGIIVGVSYAFFNYTKTGPVNLLSTGGITFTSDYESVTLNNVYPTSIYSYETDNDNVATIELNISGYTNYEKGLLYQVILEDVHNTIYSSYIKDDAYILSVRSSSSGLDNVQLNQHELYEQIGNGSVIAIGKIPPNTNVNGTITLKAFIPLESVAISDTINYDERILEAVPTDENGTTEEWLEGEEGWREAVTTEDWNGLSTNPLSFKIKVEVIDSHNFVNAIPQVFIEQKNNIEEIYFEKMDEEEINTRYNAATYKADASMFHDESVKSWLEGKKLYFASSDTIYLYDGFSFLEMNTYNGSILYTSTIKKIEFNNINTSLLTSMKAMFANLSIITSLDLSSFDTSNVTDMSSLFWGCAKLEELNLSSFDTSNVIIMSQMFQHCRKMVEFDLSNFDTSSLSDIHSMFLGCYILKTVYVSDLWNTDLVTNTLNGSSVFNGTSNIVGGAGTTYNSSHINVEYARVDDPSNNKPGYFTYKATSGT